MSLQFLSHAWDVEGIDSGIKVTLNRQQLDSKAVWVVFDELYELAMEHGQRILHVDFGLVRSLAGIAFGKLITLDKMLRDAGCQLVLGNVDPSLYRSFRAARLTENLEIREREAEEPALAGV